jgi:hypothetical protein
MRSLIELADEVMGDETRQDEEMTILAGTVGWSDHPDVCELGTAQDDGVCLVRVTLFKGAPAGKRMTPDGLANGYRVLVQPNGWPFWAIPPRGRTVYIAFPGGNITTIGSGVIIASPGPNPFKQFAEKAAKIELEGYDLVVKAGSVSIISEDAARTKRHMVSVSTEGGVQAADSTGSGAFVSNGEVVLKSIDSGGHLLGMVAVTPDETNVVTKDGAGIVFSKGDVSLLGGMISVAFTTALGLGKNASPATPVLLGVTGLAGVGSTCIWGAPTP